MSGTKANIFLITAAFMWGSGFIGSDLGLMAGLTPFQLVAGRFLLASIMAMMVFLRKPCKIQWKTVKRGFLLGIFTAAGFCFQMKGLQNTSVSNNAFICATNVVMVPFLCWAVSKKRPDFYSFLGAAMAIFGIGCLTLKSNFSIGAGDKMTFVGAFFYACNLAASGVFSKEENPMHLTLIQFATVAVLTTGLTIQEGMVLELNTKGFLAILYLAVFATMMTYCLQNIAFRFTTATQGAVILATECLFGSFLSVLILHENMTVKGMIGSAIIFCAILISETKPDFSNLFFGRRKIKGI